MHPPEDNSSSTLSARLARIRRILNGLQRSASTFEECIDGLVGDLDGFVAQAASSPNWSPPSALGLSLEEKRRLLQKQASAGARSVQITPLADRSARVQIDGRPGVILPPSVAAVFQILKADFGTLTDQMVGWKTIADIKHALLKRTGGAYTSRAVKELVYRLRRKLKDHGENPLLVESRRKLGYRLALWRGGDL